MRVVVDGISQVVCCLQGFSDLTADFRVLEMADGSVCLENVAYPGVFLGIPVEGGNKQTNLSINLCVSVCVCT